MERCAQGPVSLRRGSSLGSEIGLLPSELLPCFPEALIHQLQLGWAGSAFCLVTVHLYLLCIVMGEFYKFF